MKISIIISVYNGRNFLEETIKSCLEQTVEEKEIIIIDDCSTESSDDIIEKYVRKHNIIYIKNKENKGMIKNNNYAATIAQGQYLLFLGQDDVLRHNHVEKMIAEFDENTSFVYCDEEYIDEKGNMIKHLKVPDVVNYYFFSKESISSCGIVISHEKFNKVKGYREIERCPMYGEWSLWIDLIGVGNAKKCFTTSGMYRRHSSNITNTFNDKKKNPLLYKYHSFCRRLAHKRGKFTVMENLHYFYYYLKCAYRYYIKNN